MRNCLLLLLLLIPDAVCAESPPEAWPVVYSETYRVEAGEIRQLPLTWEGIQVRRFFLRLHASRYFEASVTRVRDGNILFRGHFEPDYQVLIPWGRDEFAHLTVVSQWEQALHITLTIATDPEEEGLEVYSYHLNRFLEFYEQGELSRAERELSAALVEDPDDEMAQLLWKRLWDERGVGSPPHESPSVSDPELAETLQNEQIRLSRLEIECGRALSIAGPDSAQIVLDAAPRFASEPARTRALLLQSKIWIARGEYGEASALLQTALSETFDAQSRLSIYRSLAGINRDLGNDHQVERIIEEALSENQDPALEEEIESWRQ